MRVFFFITKSEAGGAQTHVAQLVRSLVSRGDVVAVMSSPSFAETSSFALPPSPRLWRTGRASEDRSEGEPGGWLEHETRSLGAEFLPNPWLDNTGNPLRLWHASRTLLRAVDDFHPDLVACHSTMAGLIGRLSLRGRVPTVFTAHGWGFQPGAPLLRRWLLPMLERLAGRFCEGVICVSRNDVELARSHRIAPDDKLALIYNGVEIPDTRSLVSTPTLAPPFTKASGGRRDDTDKKNPSPVHVYFVGRLAPPKNPFLLVEAFSRLPRELQDRASVTIIGDGPDRSRLQKIVNELGLTDLVDLVGALPREQVLELVRTQADLFVLLSHWEGFPYSILEAMAVGVPVIASRVGGIPEALEQGGGILIEGDDNEALTRALASLIADDARRTTMGAQAQFVAQERFSVAQMCEKTFEVYRAATRH